MPSLTKYLNPMTDFGFKRIFCSPHHTHLLVHLLNALLRNQKQVATVTHLNGEKLGKRQSHRKGLLDLSCEGPAGEKFIIELQAGWQPHFIDRSVYYASYAIQEQGKPGRWNFHLKEVFIINLLDFSFRADNFYVPPSRQYFHKAKIVETENNRVVYDKLTFLFLELPKFKKSESQLVSALDKWLFLLTNLNKFDKIPLPLRKKPYSEVCSLARYSNLTPTEMTAYDISLKRKRDWENIAQSHFELGLREGREKAQKQHEKDLKRIEKAHANAQLERQKALRDKQKTARILKKKGIAIKDIAEATGLSQAAIRKL